MDKAREILEQMPGVKIGLDSFYGQQTVLNALNKALNIHNVTNCDCVNSTAIETTKGIICYECERPK